MRRRRVARTTLVAAHTAEPSVQARAGGNHFGLHNGTNRIALAFTHRDGRHPSALYLTAPPTCSSQHLSLSVVGTHGSLALDVVCRGLKHRDVAILRVGRAIRARFRLHRGSGTIRVHLVHPPGDVQPLVFIGTSPKDTPCVPLGHRLRLRRTTTDLVIRARCGRVARNAVGLLYVGGLLTP